MDISEVNRGIKKLKMQYKELNFKYHDCVINNKIEKIYYWPGPKDEEILVCSHQCNGVKELFHRHDFFFFNYTWDGQYDTFSQKYDNFLTIRKNELYAGQPWAGHALLVHDDQDTTIIGVLIKKETFFHLFLPLLSPYPKLFHFFADPVAKAFSEEYLHFKLTDDTAIRSILEMMILEYAFPKPDSQSLLLSLGLTFIMQIARQYDAVTPPGTKQPPSLSEECFYYINTHLDTVTLKDLSAEFSYHPGYISALLTKTYGKSFSKLLLEQRMKRALNLLTYTTFTIDQIATLVGYNDKSNFHKAFKKYYGKSPRNFLILK